MSDGTGILLQAGPFTVRWYGLLIAVGALLGGYVASLEARRRGEDPDHVWNGLIVVLILGIIGARLYHVISSPQEGGLGLRYYLSNPVEIVKIWQGGLGIYGAVIGGVIGLLLYARRHRLNPWRWLDIAAPGLILGQAIGRWGNFFNQELYGPPTTLPWGIKIDALHRLPRYADLSRYPVETTRFHPTFLYESVWNFLGFLFLMGVGRRYAHRLKDGDVILLYAIWYPLGRSVIEYFFRPDAWLMPGLGLPVAMVISLAIAVIAAIALVVRHRGQGTS
ncbi:MAG: prolipoprotein diacylglyceryl transferase [Chloroflexi bacterium]|nr:MAG: prolipoprotein diacylglyceryl transferase [Chloroflexota bacterium]